MNTVLRHTEFLLTAHDCVVIPGFGAVLRRRRPAHFDNDGRLCPPASTYAFNSELREDDGMLISSVVRATGMARSRAAALVSEGVDNMLRTLDTDGALALGRIGTVIGDKEAGTLSFIPASADALTPLASWMPVVEPVAGKNETGTEAKGTILRPRRFTLRRIATSAAAIAAIAAVAIVCSTPISVPNARFASTALPEVSAPRPAYVPSQSPAVLRLVMDGSGTVAVDTAARTAWKAEHRKGAEKTPAATAETEQPAADVRFNEKDPYIVVVASLHSRRDAEKTVADFSRRYGVRTGISTTGGYYRVYAATGASKAQALKALGTEAVKKFDGAWVTNVR